jgi:two-component system, sensor histidine kinase and response regulator
VDDRPAPLERSPAGEEVPDPPSIAGLDTNSGLVRVGNNRQLYLKLLGQFVEQQGPAADQIAAALSSKDHAVAERLAHTLKGVAGQLGAADVQSTAGTLEHLIREHAEPAAIEAARTQLAAQLIALVTALRAALPSTGSGAPEPAIPSTPPSAAQSREAAAQLTGLLSERDPGAAEFLEAHQATLRPLFDDARWRELTGLVQGYAFEDAQAQLEQALESFPS